MLCCTQTFDMSTRFVVRQKPENPLLLLGQYSDEEVEEEFGKEISHETRADSPANLDEQVKVDKHEGAGVLEDENLTVDKVYKENKNSSLDVLPKVEEIGIIEDNTAESLQRDMDVAEQASEVPMTGDVGSDWKMVLHEESNSQYYWNVVTGETSWEVPAVLTPGYEAAYHLKSGQEVEETHVTSVDTQPNNGSTNSMVIETTEITASRSQSEVHDEKYASIMANDRDLVNHANILDAGKMSSSNGFYYGSSDGVFEDHFSDGLSNTGVHRTNSNIQDMSSHLYQETVDQSSDSFRLMQLGENLSERLKSFQGCNDQISKLLFELDIRLADIKSLVPYGSSLLPFWLHSENQLKKLEAAVNNEALKFSQFANIGETNKTENKLQENNICGVSTNNAACLEFDASDLAPGAPTEDYTPKFVDGTAHEIASPADIIPNTAPHCVEDVDMDVDMDVEEGEIPAGDDAAVQDWSQSDQSVAPITERQHESRGSAEPEIPPLPDDVWVPPPPPDEEPIPPPPPDEPLESQLPPLTSEIQAAQHYTYGEQYSFSYPGSNVEYYGQTNTQNASNQYYVDANGCQVAAPLPAVYYTSVPNLYSDATSMMNDGKPAAYYTLQDGSVSTASVIGSVETSDQTKSSTALPSISAPAYAPSTSIVTSAPAVASTVAPTEPVSKAQPKVPRIKKRPVTAGTSLRSNKKVSGLVDKWKAVKEELHEDEEDEPENAYEVLEKKRQREIEQWIAQQIATGEAKDNANFQPLGGDWRERVRWKRTKKLKQVEENTAKDNDDTNQQPDLVELSKQLPYGWQAYWDETSKQIYYGNSKTSETTWTKPTS
uniref:uncharacterized protein LOC122593004 isoform X2 n=1 Tax=Erigeron canadensis TaxID=72917 RepID=UPI001CB98E6F|nr:uncharacterized protein LOC122593004 isoform X2 [Erigeron canadensis]